MDAAPSRAVPCRATPPNLLDPPFVPESGGARRGRRAPGVHRLKFSFSTRTRSRASRSGRARGRRRAFIGAARPCPHGSALHQVRWDGSRCWQVGQGAMRSLLLLFGVQVQEPPCHVRQRACAEGRASATIDRISCALAGTIMHAPARLKPGNRLHQYAIAMPCHVDVATHHPTPRAASAACMPPPASVSGDVIRLPRQGLAGPSVAAVTRTPGRPTSPYRAPVSQHPPPPRGRACQDEEGGPLVAASGSVVARRARGRGSWLHIARPAGLGLIGRQVLPFLSINHSSFVPSPRVWCDSASHRAAGHSLPMLGSDRARRGRIARFG